MKLEVGCFGSPFSCYANGGGIPVINEQNFSCVTTCQFSSRLWSKRKEFSK